MMIRTQKLKTVISSTPDRAANTWNGWSVQCRTPSTAVTQSVVKPMKAIHLRLAWIRFDRPGTSTRKLSAAAEGVRARSPTQIAASATKGRIRRDERAGLGCRMCRPDPRPMVHIGTGWYGAGPAQLKCWRKLTSAGGHPPPLGLAEGVGAEGREPECHDHEQPYSGRGVAQFAERAVDAARLVRVEGVSGVGEEDPGHGEHERPGRPPDPAERLDSLAGLG